jgi:PadR family transcriptional regulator PadR
MVLGAKVEADLRRATLAYCVLALLAEEDRYGFDLVRSLSEVQGLATTEGTIYPLLSRLRKDHLVSTMWSPSPSGPPRRYYSLTPTGREALEQFAAEWHRFRQSIDMVLKEAGLNQ